jgi:hypothetical protein
MVSALQSTLICAALAHYTLAQCPPHWTDANNYCYGTVTAQTQENAQKECQKIHMQSSLSTITNENEAELVLTHCA